MDFYAGKNGVKKQDACEQHGNPAVPGVSDGFVAWICLLHGISSLCEGNAVAAFVVGCMVFLTGGGLI